MEETEECTNCSICLSGIDNCECMKLNCNHSYHRGCIEEWIQARQYNVTCPLCRSPIDNILIGNKQRVSVSEGMQMSDLLSRINMSFQNVNLTRNNFQNVDQSTIRERTTRACSLFGIQDIIFVDTVESLMNDIINDLKNSPNDNINFSQMFNVVMNNCNNFGGLDEIENRFLQSINRRTFQLMTQPPLD